VTGPAPVDDSRISTWLRVPMNMYLDTPRVWWNTDPVGPVAVIPTTPVVRLVTVRSPSVVVGADDQARAALLLNSPLEMVIGSAAPAGDATAATATAATPTATAAAALLATAAVMARIPVIDIWPPL
jgi:hypothetical protein